MSSVVAQRPGPGAGSDGPRGATWRFHPYLALVVCAGLYLVALRVGRGFFPIEMAPSAAPVLSTTTQSKALFAVFCLAVILLSRRWPTERNRVQAFLGIVWAWAACGLVYTSVLLVVAALVYVIAPRLSSFAALFLTALLLLLTFRFVIVNQFVRCHDTASRYSLLFSIGWMGARFVVYAFEASLIPPEQRSFLAMLAYAPFSVLLWHGEPPLLSFVTLSSPRPQQELDRLGATQLYRSGIKLVLLALVYWIVHRTVPSIASFTATSVPVRILLIIAIGHIFYLQISGAADLSTGMSNLSGYHAPDAFDRPFLCKSPFEYWRSWNIHCLRFISVTCAYPILRARGGWPLAVSMAMLGSALIHAFMDCIAVGPEMHPGTRVLTNMVEAVLPLFLLLCFLPLEKRKISAGVGGWLLIQVLAIRYGFVVALPMLYGTGADAPNHVLLSILRLGAIAQ